MTTYRELLTRFVILCEFTYAFNAWLRIPASIPNDYDAHGIAQKHAPHIFVWIFLLLNIGVLLLLTAIERHPDAFNLPAARNDPDRPRQVAIALNLLGWMRLEISLLFACILYSFANEGPRHNSTYSLISVVPVILLATVILHLYRMRKPAPTQPSVL